MTKTVGLKGRAAAAVLLLLLAMTSALASDPPSPARRYPEPIMLGDWNTPSPEQVKSLRRQFASKRARAGRRGRRAGIDRTQAHP